MGYIIRSISGVVHGSRVPVVKHVLPLTAISLGKVRPTVLPTKPTHSIRYSTGPMSFAISPKILRIASAELQGCTQKHGMSVKG